MIFLIQGVPQSMKINIQISLVCKIYLSQALLGILIDLSCRFLSHSLWIVCMWIALLTNALDIFQPSLSSFNCFKPLEILNMYQFGYHTFTGLLLMKNHKKGLDAER